jgi:hypothetical protein
MWAIYIKLYISVGFTTSACCASRLNVDSAQCSSWSKSKSILLVPMNVFFFFLLFTQAETPHMLRFVIWYTVIFPGPVQETVGGAGCEPRTAASSVWCRPVAFTNWATTSQKYVLDYKQYILLLLWFCFDLLWIALILLTYRLWRPWIILEHRITEIRPRRSLTLLWKNSLKLLRDSWVYPGPAKTLTRPGRMTPITRVASPLHLQPRKKREGQGI